MSSVTETSTSALGKQGEIGRQIDSLRSIQVALDKQSVRMGVAPELWVRAEIVRGRSVGVGLLPKRASVRSSCQPLWVERDCGFRRFGALLVTQGHDGINAGSAACRYVAGRKRN